MNGTRKAGEWSTSEEAGRSNHHEEKASGAFGEEPIDDVEGKASGLDPVEDGSGSTVEVTTQDDPVQGHDAVGELSRQLDAARDQWLRATAEFRNYKRRVESERPTWIDHGKNLVLRDFLDVLDDFDRSIEAARQIEEQSSASPGPVYHALKEGFELIHRKVGDAMKKHGVEPIEAVGQLFDEHVHEAVVQREEEGADPGIVLQELQKGYRTGDRILRHSKVIVAG